MTRSERVLMAFLALLVSAFTAEHIFLIVQAELHPPQVIEACVPQPKVKP